MSTLAAVNETLLDIKGQLVRNNTKLDRVAAVKPMPSGPRDLTERERTGQTSAEAAREGLKERAGAKPAGTGVGGLIDKAPNLPVSTGNKALDYLALGGLALSFIDEITSFLKGLLDGIYQSFKKEIDAFAEQASNFVEENLTPLVSGAGLAVANTLRRMKNSVSGQLKAARVEIDDLKKQTRTQLDDAKTKTGGGGRGAPPTRQEIIERVKNVDPKKLAAANIKPAAGGGYIDELTGKQASTARLAEATKPKPNIVSRAISSVGSAITGTRPPGGVGPQATTKPAVPSTARKAVTKAVSGTKEVAAALKKIAQLKAITKGIPIVGALLGPIFAAIESLDILKTDASLEAKREAITGVLTGLLVGSVAAVMGGIVGATAGSIVPVVGNFVGAIIGGGLGFLGGDLAGRALAPFVTDYLFNGAPVDKDGILAFLSAFVEKEKTKNPEAYAKSIAATGGADGSKPNVNGTGTPGTSSYDSTSKPQATGTTTPSRASRDLPPGAKRKRGLTSPMVDTPTPGPTSKVDPEYMDEAMIGDMATVAAPVPDAARITPGTVSAKAAMVQQAAMRQSADGGNNITINKAGDIQNNMSGGGGGESPVIVLKSPSNMPPIGSKIAYGMGL